MTAPSTIPDGPPTAVFSSESQPLDPIAAAAIERLSTHRQPLAVARLLRELSDLKRLASAEFPGSMASWRFRQLWVRLIELDALATAATEGLEALRPRWEHLLWEEVAAAIIATRMAAISAERLLHLRMPAPAVLDAFQAAIHEHAAAFDQATISQILAGAERLVAAASRSGAWLEQRVAPERKMPDFVGRLVAEPRAGATAVGRSRALMVPPENHAEHCYVTGINAAVIASAFDADAVDAFLVCQLHHLHNAYLPDGGYAGEMLLGEHLATVVTTAKAIAWRQLPPQLGWYGSNLMADIAACETPLGACFNAADSLDRLLQVEFHARQASFRVEHATRDLEIVHAGPVQQFQNAFADALQIGQSS